MFRGFFQTFLENHWPARSRKRDMKAESPDKGTIAQVYLLRPVLPHLRARIPKVENIKMPVDYGIEKPRSSVRTGRQPPSPANKQPIPGQKAGLTTSPGIPDKKGTTPLWVVPFSDSRREFTYSCLRWFSWQPSGLQPWQTSEPRASQPSERQPFSVRPSWLRLPRP